MRGVIPPARLAAEADAQVEAAGRDGLHPFDFRLAAGRSGIWPIAFLVDPVRPQVRHPKRHVIFKQNRATALAEWCQGEPTATGIDDAARSIE